MKRAAASRSIYNIHEAKTHLSHLLEVARKGKKVIIAKSGVEVAELVAIKSQGSKRVLGQARGQVVIKPDFDELPEEGIGVSFSPSIISLNILPPNHPVNSNPRPFSPPLASVHQPYVRPQPPTC